MIAVQLDLFVAHQPLVGVCIKLDRPMDRERPCCGNICRSSPADNRVTLWRSIQPMPSAPPPTDARSNLGGMQQKGASNGN
jgi:hypothetical protein